MIPSVNDQKITTESFAHKDGKWTEWACDCCGDFYGNEYYVGGLALRAALGFGGEPVNPTYVEVKGVRYFSCSKECSRILFNIHHQYAMMEGSHV